MRDVAPLGYDVATLAARGGSDTAREIAQQPAMLRETQALLLARADEIAAYLAPLTARPGLRIILTGAGTSAFIGESLAPWLGSRLPCRVEAIATTDLICAPELYFERETPTLLVSFGRSGSSPESVAAFDLADRCVSEIHHLVITCNAEGALARAVDGAPGRLLIVLPAATHDRGFAMTSSYSCMAWAALSALGGIEAMQARIGAVAAAVEGVIAQDAPAIRALASHDYERVAFLGSHLLKGSAREGALKLMELTNGAVPTLFDSPLGVRHGPKTFITGQTLVFVFLSNDPYTRRYDLDLLDELRRDGEAARIVAVSAQGGLEERVDQIRIHGLEAADDVELMFPFIVVPQIFAFEQSLRHGLTPDQPNAKGTVNRVVQGVRIHERV